MLCLSADRRGVTSLEYGLLGGAIALVLVVVLRVPALELMSLLGRVAGALRFHIAGH